MIIDLILDRKDGRIIDRTSTRGGKVAVGVAYSPKRFYDDVMFYYHYWPEIVHPIAEALDNGEEADVKRALCAYVDEQYYQHVTKDYINSVNWL